MYVCVCAMLTQSSPYKPHTKISRKLDLIGWLLFLQFITEAPNHGLLGPTNIQVGGSTCVLRRCEGATVNLVITGGLHCTQEREDTKCVESDSAWVRLSMVWLENTVLVACITADWCGIPWILSEICNTNTTSGQERLRRQVTWWESVFFRQTMRCCINTTL